MLLNQTDYARHVGTTRMTISKKVKAGYVILTDDKMVDTENPVNLEFEKYIRDRKKRGFDKGRTGRPIGISTPKIVPRVDFSQDLAYPEKAEDLIRHPKSFADQLKVIEAWEDKRLSNAERRGELIDRALVKKFISRLYAIDTNEFLAAKDKIANIIAGLCGVTDDGKISEIGMAVHAELYKTLSHIKRLTDDFLKGLER